MNLEQTQTKDGLSGKWIGANVLGWGIGLAALQAVLSAARLGFYDPIERSSWALPTLLSPSANLPQVVMMGIGVGGIIGATLGIMRWFTQRYVPTLLGWFVISSVGGGILSTAILATLQARELVSIEWLRSLRGIASALEPSSTGGILIGLGVGLTQWFVLQKRLHHFTAWLGASIATGAFFANLIFIPVVLQLRAPFIFAPVYYPYYGLKNILTTWTMPWMMPFAVAAILFGLAIGFAQGWVLRPWLPQFHWWLLVNAAGGLLGWFATADPVFWRTFLAVAPPIYVAGWLAVMQWTILQSKVRNAGWWIPVSTVTGGLGLFVGIRLISLVSALFRDALGLAILLIAFAPLLALGVGAIGGGIYGSLTLFLLKRLLKDSPPVSPAPRQRLLPRLKFERLDILKKRTMPRLTEITHHLSRLEVKLLVAWSGGFAWGLSAVSLVNGVLCTLYGPVDRLLDSRRPVGWETALLLLLVSPALLGGLFAQRCRGWFSGLLAVPALVSMLLIWGLATSAANALFWSPWWRLFDYTLLQRIVDWGPSLFTQWFIATVMIAFLLWLNTPPFPNRWRGLGYGLLVSALLTLASGVGLALLRDNLLAVLAQPAYWDRYLSLRFYLHDAIFEFLWQMPALVWVSTVYIFETTRQTSGRLGFLTWVILLAATFGIPFVIPWFLPVILFR